LEVLVATKLVASKSEAYRMAKQNAIRLDGKKLHDVRVEFSNPGVLQVGKRKFVRVK
jgi:tyrosyl-tRNA synthetase